MQIPVLVERLKGNGYRARGPFSISVKGSTREDALAKLQAKIQDRLNGDTELVELEIGPQPNPWLKHAGIFKDDPLFDDWQKAIKEYRRAVEEDPNYP